MNGLEHLRPASVTSREVGLAKPLLQERKPHVEIQDSSSRWSSVVAGRTKPAVEARRIRECGLRTPWFSSERWFPRVYPAASESLVSTKGPTYRREDVFIIEESYMLASGWDAYMSPKSSIDGASIRVPQEKREHRRRSVRQRWIDGIHAVWGKLRGVHPGVHAASPPRRPMRDSPMVLGESVTG
jgi:hypothetical protein